MTDAVILLTIVLFAVAALAYGLFKSLLLISSHQDSLLPLVILTADTSADSRLA